MLARLNANFSVWHDLRIGVMAGGQLAGIDHIVVGHQGVVLVESIEEKDPIIVRNRRLTKGGESTWVELIRPRMLAASRIFPDVSAILLVFADAALVDPGHQRIDGFPVPAFAVGSSRLADTLLNGLPGMAQVSRGRHGRLRDSAAGVARFA